MVQNICFFIGHRDAPDSIYPDLLRAVEEHITKHGVTEYVVGHYGRFDSMAAEAVMEGKKRHPQVKLTMLLPYHPAKRKIILPQGFDGSWYPPGMETVPPRVAVIRANRCAVDRARYLITYVRHPGNAKALVEYAKNKLLVTEV